MKLTLIQANPVVGDIAGNSAQALDLLHAYRGRTDLLILSELFICGYPPRDLLFSEDFMDQVESAVTAIASATADPEMPAIALGAPRRRTPDAGAGTAGIGRANSALLIADGAVIYEQDKALLPNYDVFTERRYFDPAPKPHIPCDFQGYRIGFCICEDAWVGMNLPTDTLYDRNPVAELAAAGADLVVNLSASPFHYDKERLRFHLANEHCRTHNIAFVWVNQVGANDELIFDGRSFAIGQAGQLLVDLRGFDVDEATFDIQQATTTPDSAPKIADLNDLTASLHPFTPSQAIATPSQAIATPSQAPAFQAYTPLDAMRSALVLGVRDYFQKTGAQSALIGLSGGIDSSLVACIATEALGAAHVHGLTLPGPYSSLGSTQDSEALAERLGIAFTSLSIEPIYAAYLKTLAPVFQGAPADVTEENIQARIRGALLMAIANKQGHLVLCTSNKSEAAIGYTTLYGDAVGALSVIGDLLKGQVYELAQSYNDDEPLIPQAVLDKPPSAELRPDQQDSDTLPPYDKLDAIVRLCVESGYSAATIVEAGYDPETVDWVMRRIRQNEYKRWQVPFALKVSRKSFGQGRLFPLAADYA